MADGDGKETEFSTLACEGIWGPDLIFLCLVFLSVCSLVLAASSLHLCYYGNSGLIMQINQSYLRFRDYQL